MVFGKIPAIPNIVPMKKQAMMTGGIQFKTSPFAI